MRRILCTGFLLVGLSACQEESTAPKPNALSKESPSTNRPPDSVVAAQAIAPMPKDIYQRFVWYGNETKKQLTHSTPQQIHALYTQLIAQQSPLLETMMTQQTAFLDNYYAPEYWQQKCNECVRPSALLLAKQQQMARFGLEYWEIGEGIVLIRPQADYYLKLFGADAPADMQAYLKIRSKQDKVLDQSDAGLIISFAELGQRIHEWEQFLDTYPKSPLAKEAKIQYAIYQNWFLLGLDNTPAYHREAEGEGAQVEPEAEAAWTKYQQRYPNSLTARLIQSTLAIPPQDYDLKQQQLQKRQEQALGIKLNN